MPGRDDLAVIADRLPLAAEAAGLPSGSGHALGRTRTTSTDSGGRFQLADMLPGRVFVEINRAGNVPYRTGALALQPGQRLELPAVSLRGGVPLTGRVVDDGDAPVEGARVLITAASGGKASGAGPRARWPRSSRSRIAPACLRRRSCRERGRSASPRPACRTRRRR